MTNETMSVTRVGALSRPWGSRALIAAMMMVLAAGLAVAQPQPSVTDAGDGWSRAELGGGFVFEWTVDGDEIEGKISAPTTGWVAIGFNPTNRMQGATYVIGYVQNNTVNMRHDWGHTPTGHQAVTAAGGTSRLTAIGGSERNGRTELHFRLPMNPGDRFFSPIKAGERNTVIWAFGPNGSNNYTAYHAQRGAVTIAF